MKDKLNGKFKQQFFGQYFWQQRIFRFGCPGLNGDPEGEGDVYTLNGTVIEQDSETSYLRLKTLSSITDEDATELTRICLNPKEKLLTVLEIQKWDWCWNIIVNKVDDFYDGKPCEVQMYIRIVFDRQEIKWVWDYNHERGIATQDRHCSDISAGYDYLRSKGYAVPWMGITVEQMVEADWIQLIE